MVCGNCKKEITYEARFCPYCGNSMDTAASSGHEKCNRSWTVGFVISLIALSLAVASWIGVYVSKTSERNEAQAEYDRAYDEYTNAMNATDDGD